jgi:hypothetical protein
VLLLSPQVTATTAKQTKNGKLTAAALMLQMPLGTCSFATEQADGSVNAKLFCYGANISLIDLHC